MRQNIYTPGCPCPPDFSKLPPLIFSGTLLNCKIYLPLNARAREKIRPNVINYHSASATKLQFPYIYIGGSRGRAGHTPPPMGPNSFVFTYIFTKKHPCWRSSPPQWVHTPPTGNPGSATGLQKASNIQSVQLHIVTKNPCAIIVTQIT